MRGFFGSILLVALLTILFLGQGVSLYTDWLWFREVGFTQIFARVLSYKFLLATSFGILFFFLIYLNLRFAARSTAGIRTSSFDNLLDLPDINIVDPMIRRLLLPASLLLGLFAAPQAGSQWQAFILYFNPVPFGVEEPLFGRDIGFYIFQMPALKFLYNWLIFALGMTFLGTAFVYLLYRGVQYTQRGLIFVDSAKTHLLVLIAVLLLVHAFGYMLDAYELLFSPRGAAFGASYADVYANLPALRILTALAVIAAGLAVFQIFRPGLSFLLGGAGVLIAVHVLGLYLYPSFLQRFRVVPNEIDAERLYIKRNIEFTRKAYGLDKVESKDFPAEENLSADDLARNELTIKNVRLWEHRPLLVTYGQLQEIRTYYKFVDVDNDRYTVDGNYRQVMLSARELSHEHLPSRIWINEHLVYTHGYGVVFGPVNEVTREGLPEFYIQDIPPVSNIPLQITRPEIYYGEVANDYVFVRTKAQELDYPAGDRNVYTNYEGQGGVPIRSFWRKLLFSIRYGTLRITLSDDIVPESRILYYRQIHDRVRKIAPFITFDRDAYLVIAQGGRLFWIIDGYTTTDRYPYSEPADQRANYIRNSVKAVVDAYNGTVAFYLSDPQDPVIQAWVNAFPDFVRPLESMPEDLRAHIRYPQDFFTIQARIYTTYHMQDPQVFYNKEDLLSIPRKTEERQEEVMGRVMERKVEREVAPYYMIMRLPGEDKEEFILLLPFTPNKRDNMRAWLAARSDPPHYGKLIALDFPKAKLIYGPKQIDARIEQDAFISQQLSLWSQLGSQVIRGSLLAIPVEKSLIYVQPLYLAAETGSLPELKRVITAFGNRIAMEETLDQSLQRIFGDGRARERPQVVALPEMRADPKDLARKALEHYNRSQEFLRQGDLARFGEELRKVETALKELQKTAP